jgi:ADP-heptose:LPS heptosyltransferase
MGIELDSTQIHYQIKWDERQWAEELYPRTTSMKRIGVQVMASAMYRSYPHISELIHKLASDGFEVFLFGRHGSVAMETSPANVINVMARLFNFRQSAAILGTCDMVVAPDSALFHLGGALNLPTLGLYGPFPPQLRATSPCQKAIVGEVPCSPCFFHALRQNEFPVGKPCEQAGACVALAQISPDEIIDAVCKMTGKITFLP